MTSINENPKTKRDPFGCAFLFCLVCRLDSAIQKRISNIIERVVKELCRGMLKAISIINSG
jgi:hypothetical protein